jgi:hypothetical protein
MTQVTSTCFVFSCGYSSPFTIPVHLFFVHLLQEYNWLNDLNNKSIIVKEYATNFECSLLSSLLS